MTEKSPSPKDRPNPSACWSESDQIARNIKRVYDDVANEPIPGELQALLERLKHTPRR